MLIQKPSEMMKIPDAVKKLSVKNKISGLIAGFAFLVVFGSVGVYFLTSSHAATPVASQTCTVSSTLVNSCRPWFGAAVSGIPGGGSTQLSQYQYLENQVGHGLDTYRQYSACGSDGAGGITCKHGFPFAAGSDSVYFATHGKIVDLNWKPYTDFADADGRNTAVNNEIAQAAKNIAAVAPHKVMLTIWWEPQMSTNSYAPSCPNSYPNATGGSAAEYDAMWKNVQNIFAQNHATNVVWAVDYLSTGQTDFDCQVPQLWPVKAGARVDWVLFDTYGTNNHPTWAGSVGRIYGYLKGINSTSFNIAHLPWGIGETGNCGDVPDASANPPVTMQQSVDTARQFFVDAKTSFDQNAYPNLKLYQIWDDNISGNGGSECLTGYDVNNQPDPQKQQDFNAFANAVLTSGASTSPTPSVSISAPKGGSTVSGTATVTASASVSAGSISSLVLKEGNTTLKTCSNSTSCSASWDTTKVANGSYTLAADATASGGGTSQQTANVTVNNKVGGNCSLTAILLNPCRPLIGAAAHGNAGAASDPASQFSYLEKLIGNQMDVYRDYHAPLSDTSNSNSSLPLDPNTKEGQAEIAIANSGKILDLNWDVTHTWKQALPVSAGGDPTINSQIDQAAANIKKLPHKVFLSPWHEANLHIGAADNSSEACSHFNQSSPNGTPAQFVAAWQNIYNHFKADGVTNVVWVLNYGSYPPNDCWIPYMWPGNNDVDWVIVDTYSSYAHLNWDQSAGNFYTNVLKANSTATRNFDSKPWGIGEFGDCNAPDPQQAYDYFNSVTAAVKANTYPNYKMYLMYADTGNNAGPGCLSNYDPNGTLDQQKEQDVNAMFAAMLQGSSGNPAPTVSIAQPKSGTTVSGSAVSVTATAGTTSGSITNITLTAGGSSLASCSSSPCNTTWDTTGLANGGTTIEADVTASDGRMATAIETVTVKNPSPVTLTAPSYLVSPSQTTTSIALEWKASTDTKYPASQISYTVYRNGNKVGTTGPGVTNYTDGNLQTGTTYSYTVSATDPSGKSSAQSTPLTQATQQPPCTPPPAPAGFTGSATSPTSVKLAWQPVSSTSNTCQVAYYVLERNGVVIAQPKTANYVDSSLTPGTAYTYTVAAELVGNIPGASTAVSVTTPKQPTDPGPTPPSDLVAYPFGLGEAILFWHPSSDPASGIKDYQVLRNGKYRASTTYPAFGDTGLQPSTTYTYQVIAVSGNGKVAASKQVKVTTYPGCYPGWTRTLECRVPPGPPAY